MITTLVVLTIQEVQSALILQLLIVSQRLFYRSLPISAILEGLKIRTNLPHKNTGLQVIKDWLVAKGLQPFPFQEETWQHYVEGLSGVVNAPTGFGKTYSVFLAILIDWINRHPDYQKKKNNKLQLLWVTPLRALAKDIHRAMEEALTELEIPWRVAVRNGDTSTADRQKQKQNMPEILLITPESLHLLIGSTNHKDLFKTLSCVAVDEWHELLGSKRGVQIELALAHLKRISHTDRGVGLSIWGISATIGNLEQAMAVLLGDSVNGVIVRADLKKEIRMHAILPETVERFPWAGHLGLNMVEEVLPVIENSKTTLLFANVRSQAEMWYQALLKVAPDLAGLIALHHSSIDAETRMWVEEALHKGVLKVVVCTASLDLGVDFRPVDTVIQVGSPKGIARFLQRAGRSGHSPGEVSNIYFVPTHSLEIVEAVALQKAYDTVQVESRVPIVVGFDVLVQYMVTMAVGDGFVSEELLAEVRTTHCYQDLSDADWEWMQAFITTGGSTLKNYDEYHKVVLVNGVYKVLSRKVAMRHRMHIGTIVGDPSMKVKLMSGRYIGTIEEYFISRLEPGDSFVLAGRVLELVRIKDMTVYAKNSTAKNAHVPAWGGGRMPLSANLGEVLRETFQQVAQKNMGHEWLDFLQPLFDTQRELSVIPKQDELLVEFIEAKDGYHMFVYPFEGRLVHQSMASLLAHRLTKQKPITFSIAMNDYGFELLSDQSIPVDENNIKELFNPKDWYVDLKKSINDAEMGRRKFRDIAVIAGLIFQGYPGAQKRQRHLQNSTGLLYRVLSEHEPAHTLLQQAAYEVLTYEMEAERLHHSLERIYNSKIVITHPAVWTPLCFPIKVDSLRDQLSSERLEDRIARMQAQSQREN